MIRVLIADDHDTVRKCVRTVLEIHNDVRVCAEAADGAEAITKAVEFHPDLVILDLTMPVKGGFEAATELRRIMPEVPILFCSIQEGPEVTKNAKQIGVRGYISKQHMSDLLIHAVDALVVHKTTFFPNPATGTY